MTLPPLPLTILDFKRERVLASDLVRIDGVVFKAALVQKALKSLKQLDFAASIVDECLEITWGDSGSMVINPFTQQYHEVTL